MDKNTAIKQAVKSFAEHLTAIDGDIKALQIIITGTQALADRTTKISTYDQGLLPIAYQTEQIASLPNAYLTLIFRD